MNRAIPDEPREQDSLDGPAVTVQGDFERFHQSNDIFCRGFWDPKVALRSTRRFFRSFVKPGERMRNEEGFTQRDFALRNGPWVVTETFAEMHKAENRRDGFWDDFRLHIPPSTDAVDVGNPAAASSEVKRVARLYGADLVGIANYDERLTYASSFTARGGHPSCKLTTLPEGLRSVVVIAKAMDYELIRTSPSSTASAAPAIGYAHDATVLLALAHYIRALGFTAVACQNDATLAIPYAIQAGLGEYGRHGLLITKEYGPRIRLGRVLTDMPLAPDRPFRFGVTETCQVCRRCANNCPPQAISHGEPSTYRYDASNIRGIRKWTTDAKKCFLFWVSRGTDCANCIRTCPYNKDFSKARFRLLRFLLGTRLRRLVLTIDDGLRLHDRLGPSGWWAGKSGAAVERAEGHRPDAGRIMRQERARAIYARRRGHPRREV